MNMHAQRSWQVVGGAGVLLSSILMTVGGAARAEIGPQETRNGAGYVPDIFSHRESYRTQIDLNGAWEFRRDPDGLGEEEGWHEGKGEFGNVVKIPGAPQAQGHGESTERLKNFFLEPFWVRRSFTAPGLGSDQRVWLRIGGILPAAEVYINGAHVGYTQSSRTPQRVDLTRFVKPSAENLIAIKVSDFPTVRLDGLWEMAECAKYWTGLYRPISCEITNRVSVLDAYIQPKVAAGSVIVTVELSEPPSTPLRLVFDVKDGEQSVGAESVDLPAGDKQAQGEIRLRDFTTWSPEHPKLYRLDISVMKSKAPAPLDRVGIRFGMREMSAKGSKFYLNGKPIFWRLFGDDQFYPETLCPPADKDWYLARLKRARAYGMNGAKSCVETLPPEYLEAADEAGILIIQEMPFGLSDLRANRYTIDERFRDYYAKELDGLVRASRNYASVVAYSMSSELDFASQTQESFDFFSRDLPRRTRRLAPHALVIDCTGYVDSEQTAKGKRETDFFASVHPKWMKEVLDETPMKIDGLHPTLLHEYNWWSCYPDPTDKDKYASAQIKPFWLNTLVRSARENGQEEWIPTYRRNSLWLQALCRKDGIEYARRSPGIEGYILWLLVDFGQYSEGLLDDFWNPKNVSAEEFLESNGETVILLAKEDNRCLAMGNKTQIPLAISHYGEADLADSTLRWKATKDALFQEGTFRIEKIVQGELTQAGCVELVLPVSEKAFKFELRVALEHDGRVSNTNEWSFWAFPEVREEPRNVAAAENAGKTIGDRVFVRLGAARSQPIPDKARLVIADVVDDVLANNVDSGGKCLLFSTGSVIENTGVYAGSTTFYRNFRTIPWNAGKGNSGTVIAEHPALGAFPHEGMCDLQFLSMVRGILPMEFSPLRAYGVSPIIRAIDWYVTNQNNAYLFELKVGKGKVLATTLGLLPASKEHIEARCLLDCLVSYAQGDQFEPDAHVPKAEFVKLFSPRPGGR